MLSTAACRVRCFSIAASVVLALPTRALFHGTAWQAFAKMDPTAFSALHHPSRQFNLTLTKAEISSRATQSTAMTMHCFWPGNMSKNGYNACHTGDTAGRSRWPKLAVQLKWSLSALMAHSHSQSPGWKGCPTGCPHCTIVQPASSPLLCLQRDLHRQGQGMGTRQDQEHANTVHFDE